MHSGQIYIKYSQMSYRESQWVTEKKNNHMLALVVRNKGHIKHMFGRNLMEAIKSNWDSIFCVDKVPSELKKVLDAHKELFKEHPGTVKNTKAKIYLRCV